MAVSLKASRAFRIAEYTLCAYALIGGVISLLGWIYDMPGLTDWEGGGISIQPNTAICSAIAALAIMLLIARFGILGAICGAMVFFIGAATIFQTASGIDLGIDTLFHYGRPWGAEGTLSPGRMGMPGAMSWILLGLSIVILGSYPPAKKNGHRPRVAAVTIAFLALLISSISIFGYMFGADVLYTLPLLTSIAFQTATFVFALSVAIILKVDDVGIGKSLADSGPTGILTRRILPVSVAVPILFGLLQVIGSNAALYDNAFGTAIATLVEIILLVSLLWWTGNAIDRLWHRSKEFEHSLGASENRFSRFMHNLPGLAWIKNSDGHYVFANEPALKAFGQTAVELYGKTDTDIFPPEIAAAFIENDRKALEDGSGHQTVEVLEDKTGVLRHSLVNKFPIDMGDDAPMIGGIAIDITEQKRIQDDQEFLFRAGEVIRTSLNAEELLARLSEETGKYLKAHRCLFNEIDIDADTETILRDYSRTGESIVGTHKISDYSSTTSQSMMTGKTVVNYDSKSDPRTAEYFDKTYGPAKERAYIAVPMMRDGRWVASFWCSDDKSREWSAQEVALLENIAERAWAAVERLRSEQRIRESEERFRNMADYAPGMIWVSDESGSFIHLSKRWCDFTGLDPEAGLDKGWIETIHPDDKLNVSETFAVACKGRQGFRLEYRLRRHDGAYRWVIDSALPRFSESSDFLGFIGSVVDITDRKEAETLLEDRVAERTKELAETSVQLESEMRVRERSEAARIELLKRLFTVQEDERGRIARDIHDQLGQRLTALRLKISSLRNLVSDDPLVHQRISRLEVISENIDREVSFLAWELRPAILDDLEFLPALEQYVNEWSRFSEINAEFRQLHLEGVKINADIATNLYRITQEALNNVAKYSKATLVNVILEKRGQDLMLIIEDDGVGFDPAIVSDGGERGRGFGLFGMRERAALIFGEFEIESAQGNGTTIFVRVPLEGEAAASH